MEHIDVTVKDGNFYIEGFPDAVKVIRLSGASAQRLADVSSHRADLVFARHCLDELKKIPDESGIMREALWRCAIIHFMKCFQDSKGRKSLKKLDGQALFKDPPNAAVVFQYFKSLRDKFLVHDENAYAQFLPGAILGKRDAPYKIEKIICHSVRGNTLEQANYSNLSSAISRALDWVNVEFDRLCDMLIEELEEVPYDDLLSRNQLSYRVPTLDEIDRTRHPH